MSVSNERLTWLYELHNRMIKFNQLTTGIIELDIDIWVEVKGYDKRALEQVQEVTCFCGKKYVSRVRMSIRSGLLMVLDKCACGLCIPMKEGLTYMRPRHGNARLYSPAGDY